MAVGVGDHRWGAGEAGGARVEMGAEVLRGGVVLAEAGTEPGDGRNGRLSVISRRNDSGGERATRARRSSWGHQWWGRWAPLREGGARGCSVGSERRTEVAGTDMALMAESGRVEWWWGMLVDEGEMEETVLCSSLRGDKVVTTWGGGHQWRMVTTTSPHTVSRACTRVTDVSRLSSHCGWQVGPGAFLIFQDFQSFNSKSVTLRLVKIQQILHRDSWKNKEQLFFLVQLQIQSRFHVKISGTNSNLNLTWIWKGFKPF
jgi:hypothetical protein